MELDSYFIYFYELVGTYTSWGTNFIVVRIYGVKNTSLEHLLILVKVLFNASLYLVIWERSELRKLNMHIEYFRTVMLIRDCIPSDARMSFTI